MLCEGCGAGKAGHFVESLEVPEDHVFLQKMSFTREGLKLTAWNKKKTVQRFVQGQVVISVNKGY